MTDAQVVTRDSHRQRFEHQEHKHDVNSPMLLPPLFDPLEMGPRVIRRAASTMRAIAMPRGPKHTKHNKTSAAANSLGALSPTALDMEVAAVDAV